jgi:genome maintenance exonuclease 1
MKTFRYVEGLPTIPELTKVEVDGRRLYTTPSGLKLPSVTTVLGHTSKDHITEWKNKIGHDEADAITRRAGVRGTKFHSLMERYLGNQSNLFEGVMPDMKQAFRDVMPALDLIDDIHYMEATLYSETLGIAGRTDCIAHYGNVLSVIDFKTARRPKKEEWIENYFEQATCYAIMYEEMVGIPIDQIVIIISVDHEREPQVFIRDKSHYVDSLLDKIETYKKEMELVP